MLRIAVQCRPIFLRGPFEDALSQAASSLGDHCSLS